MSWLDTILPIFVGNRTQITSTLLVLLNAARLILPLFGISLPLLDQIGSAINGAGAGAVGLFAAAKINRAAPPPGTKLKDPVVVKTERGTD